MNLYEHLRRVADSAPERIAVFAPGMDSDPAGVEHESISFGELDRRTGPVAAGLRGLDVEREDRVVLMVPVSIDLYVIVAALFRIGAVPVLLDPWMGVERMADCIRRTEPRVFVGVPLAHALFLWRPGLRRLRRVFVRAPRWLPGRHLERMDGEPLPPETLGDDAPALITFTGGSTGRPKGVHRSHGLLQAQHEGTSRCMDIRPGDVQMQAFPNMVMSHIASGATSVIPWFRQGQASKADPAALVRQVEQFGVTGICGPPALLDRLAQHCVDQGVQLSTVRKVLVGGSAVGFEALDRLESVTRPGAAVVLYGSSEAEPLATLEGRDEIDRARSVLERGGGLCMGRPAAHLEMDVRILPTGFDAAGWDEAAVAEASLAPGEIGEIVVSGRHVSRRYYNDPDAEARWKVRTGDGRQWHRLGDLGYLDEAGRIYLVGRSNDAIPCGDELVYPLTVEPVLDALPFVVRSGIVSVDPGDGELVVVAFEPVDGVLRGSQSQGRRERIRDECVKLGVQVDGVVEVAEVPVDRRHNGKVDRPELVRLCRGELGKRARKAR